MRRPPSNIRIEERRVVDGFASDRCLWEILSKRFDQRAQFDVELLERVGFIRFPKPAAIKNRGHPIFALGSDDHNGRAAVCWEGRRPSTA